MQMTGTLASMLAREHAMAAAAPNEPTDPRNLRVLVVDSKASSRQLVVQLLRACSYHQVTACRTARAALEQMAQSVADAEAPFDLILKEHEPPGTNACRLLRRMAKSEILRRVPVVVMSTQDDRDVVMNCLTLGAIDYLVKPLRQNELRHIWTRVWWWRRTMHGLPGALTPNRPPPVMMRGQLNAGTASGSSCTSSSDSKETKCDEEEEPTSKEGSAPDGNGNGHGSNGDGSNGNGSNGNGSNGSKEGNGTSRVEAKPHGPNANNGNGSSDNKNGNGNSATKNGHNGSNGNGASTTLAEKNGNALVNTAEGKLPQGMAADGAPAAKSNDPLHQRSSHATRYTGPATTSRKRPSSDPSSNPQGCMDDSVQPAEQGRSSKMAHRERTTQHLRSGGGGNSNGNHTASEDTFHTLARGGGNLGNLGAQKQQTNTPSHEYGNSQGMQMQPGVHSHFHQSQGGLMPNALPRGGLSNAWPAPQHSHQHHLATLQQAAQQPNVLPHPFAGLFPAPYGLPPQLMPQQLHPALALYAAGAASQGAAPGHSHGHSADAMHHAHHQVQVPFHFQPLSAEQMLAAEAVAAVASSGHAHLSSRPQMSHSGEVSGGAPSSSAPVNPLLFNTFLQAYISSTQQSAPPPPQLPGAQLSGGHVMPHNNVGLPPGWRPPHHPFAALANVLGVGMGLQPPPGAGGSAGMGQGSMHVEASLVSGGNNNATSQGQYQQQQRMKPHTSLGTMPEPHKRRTLALEKYRKKRENLNFSKTIRYESRKQLAQQRPRIKGQFVKHANGKNEAGADDNDNPNSAQHHGYWEEDDYDNDEEDEMDDDMDDREGKEGAAGGAMDETEGNGEALGPAGGGRGPCNQEVKAGTIARKAQEAEDALRFVGEDEADVVNSLLGMRDAPAKMIKGSDTGGQAGNESKGAAHAGQQQQASRSVGSQSGREGLVSRGSHGRSLSHQKQAQQLSPTDGRTDRDAADRGGRDRGEREPREREPRDRDPRECGEREARERGEREPRERGERVDRETRDRERERGMGSGGSNHHSEPHGAEHHHDGNAHGNNGGGKNGSDSGSNSPDENGAGHGGRGDKGGHHGYDQR